MIRKRGKNDKLLKILEKSLNKSTKSPKRKEYETMLKIIKKLEENSENNSFEKIII